MTQNVGRKRKLDMIKKYRPYLFAELQREVPNLVAKPYSATKKEIATYNKLISLEGERDQNKTAFKNRFSF